MKKWEWNRGKTQLEGTSGGLWSNLLFKAGSALQSHQVIFEISKDRDCTNLPGPQSHWLAVLMRKTFLYISSQSLSFQLTGVVSCPPIVQSVNRLAPSPQ